jgi:hypothetical protein
MLGIAIYYLSPLVEPKQRQSAFSYRQALAIHALNSDVGPNLGNDAVHGLTGSIFEYAASNNGRPENH